MDSPESLSGAGLANTIRDRGAYGSLGNVYNPYQPLTSREYIAQEIAAGRMDSVGTDQDIYSPRRCYEGPAGIVSSRDPTAHSQPLDTQIEDPPTWRSSVQTDAIRTFRHRSAGDLENLPWYVQERSYSAAHSRRHHRRLIGQNSHYHVVPAASDTDDDEDDTAMTAHQMGLTSGSSGLEAHLCAARSIVQQHPGEEGQMISYSQKRPIVEGQSENSQVLPLSTIAESLRGPGYCKRRRVDRSPESPAISNRTRKFVYGPLIRAKVAAVRSEDRGASCSCKHLESQGSLSSYHDPSTHNQDSTSSRHTMSIQGWPDMAIPLEIFTDIAKHLSHKDLKSMRLVNKEFESKISDIPFRSIVVSFTPKIYGKEIKGVIPCGAADEQGGWVTNGQEILRMTQSRFSERPQITGSSENEQVAQIGQSATSITAHDGMTIFSAWGRQVKQFAFAFEIDYDQLSQPLKKVRYEKLPTFWGSYNWPPKEYQRYQYCFSLENKADEYSGMKEALSRLTRVEQLGICLDNGLGWLAGPDISDRAQIFQQKCKVFGSRKAEEKEQYEKRQTVWDAILRILEAGRTLDSSTLDSATLGDDSPFYPTLLELFDGGNGQDESDVHAQKHPPLVFDGIDLSRDDSKLSMMEVNFREGLRVGSDSRDPHIPLIPNKLTTPQQEWLMEMDWAQAAFIDSYCMAVIDNKQTFNNVCSLNVAKLPSNYLTKLQREDFWSSLQHLRDLKILVSANFRKVSREGSGVVTATDISPSLAVGPFFFLLRTFISKIEQLNALKIGYIGGGEHETGMFGRNRFVLPAPLVDYRDSNVFTSDYTNVLAFEHIESLTLVNCWVAPPIIKNTISSMRRAKLRSVTLDSVSLSAHTGVRAALVPNLLENNPSRYINRGTRRTNDSQVPDGFFSQRSDESDPIGGRSIKWIHDRSRIGSWADVLDSISPGPTLDMVRYAYHYCDQVPPIRDNGVLEAVYLKSCGYVRLVNVNHDTLDQDCMPDFPHSIPICLQERCFGLMPLMMERKEDQLLGRIIQDYCSDDLSVFQTGLPMTLGWGKDEKKYHSIEDCQLKGGSGRFSGNLQKFSA
ncbi:hypothetical protein ACLMJK_002279 [Lecanora helva]